MPKTKLRYTYFGGYLRFTTYWWKDLFHYLYRGWWRDLYYFYHRGRYGWCSRDVWNLHNYLDKVIGETLAHLAETTHGAPGGYPNRTSTEGSTTDFEQWSADLRRWSAAFLAVSRDDYYEIHGTNYQAWFADEKHRSEERDAAFRELLPWWEALWD